MSNAISSGRITPAYLFTGSRGTGKTSSARILAKSLNCLEVESPTTQPCGKCNSCQAIANGSSLDVVELDAASNSGVENIREIIERCQFAASLILSKIGQQECLWLTPRRFAERQRCESGEKGGF